MQLTLMTAGPESVCLVSTTLSNTCDVKDVGYDELVALRGHCLVKLQQICLRTYYIVDFIFLTFGIMGFLVEL